MDFLQEIKRTKKKRTFGITSIADFGIPIGLLKQILDDYHPFIDIAKIAIGSAYVTPRLEEKIQLFKDYQIQPYFGGTLFEKSYYEKKLDPYFETLKDLDIEWVEISNGTLPIPLTDRLKIISEIKNEFNVLAEIGLKDKNKELSIEVWKEEIHQLLEAGCQYVITEGRDSGTAGIYDVNGAVKINLIDEMAKEVELEKIIFEAPEARQQMFFINRFGPNVNLGNIRPFDVLTLEVERNGLRSETFYLGDKYGNNGH